VRANSSDFVNGWTIGGGAEFAICSRLSLGVEYDYADLDKDYWKISCPTCPSGVGGGVPVVEGDIKLQSVTRAPQLPLRGLAGLGCPENAGEDRVHVLHVIAEIELRLNLVGRKRLAHVLVGE
jgi:hypothetical protein